MVRTPEGCHRFLKPFRVWMMSDYCPGWLPATRYYLQP